MRVLVCGGRTFMDRAFLCMALDEAHRATPISLLIHGAAPGADTLAEDWAKSRAVPYLGHPAEWARYGSKAGKLRNVQMLQWRPEVVFAFPGDTGTRSMMTIAADAGIPVVQYAPLYG